MAHSNADETRDHLEDASYRELRLLEEVERTPDVSQRHLALRLGIALGVANLLVRNLVKEGYIRAARVGWRQWIYIVTPAGFARKVHLTVGYVERFLDHYRRVRTLVRDEVVAVPMNAESVVAIYGTTELAELMYMALKDVGVSNIDFFDRKGNGRSFLGLPVQGLESLAPADYAKVIVAFSTDLEARCHELYTRGVVGPQIVTLFHNSDRDGKSGKPEHTS